jgi:RNA polymerase sigma-70 factor (ECF subfamily)
MADVASGLPDGDLLRLIAIGDRDAFSALYHRYQDIVFRFALQMSGSDVVAADVTQDVFLLVLTRHANRYDPSQASFSTYLYGVARHMTRRRLHRERRFVTLGRETRTASERPEPIVAGSALDDVVKQQRIEQVRRAVVSLPSRYREVIVLCDLHEHSYAEASAIIGCAVGTVRSRLHRGRSLLHDKLESLNQPAWCESDRSARYCL